MTHGRRRAITGATTNSRLLPILWSFAARALEICKSQHLSPFSAQEQKRKIEDFRIVADYAFAISSFFCNYCVPAVSLTLLQRAKMLRSFCNGYKCFKAITILK